MTEQESKIEDEEKDIVDQIEKEMKERESQKNSVIMYLLQHQRKKL